MGPESTLTWDLWVDKATAKPIRRSRLVVTKGKKVKDDVFDYTFEHLTDDHGINWRLDPAQLQK